MRNKMTGDLRYPKEIDPLTDPVAEKPHLVLGEVCPQFKFFKQDEDWLGIFPNFPQ